MPRHPSLVPLSHDHHHSLVLALRLKKGGPASQHDNWPNKETAHAKETLRFAEMEILPHFRIEEEILFGTIDNDEVRGLEPELIADHTAIRGLLKELLTRLQATADTGIAALLIDIGRLLEAHIRREEREYFPMLESAADPDVLRAIGLKILEAHDPESPFRVCKL